MSLTEPVNCPFCKQKPTMSFTHPKTYHDACETKTCIRLTGPTAKTEQAAHRRWNRMIKADTKRPKESSWWKY